MVVMTTEVLRNMIYADVVHARRARRRGARRGALPPGPVPRAGLGGGDRAPRPHGAARVPVGNGVQRGRGGGVDRHRARPHRAVVEERRPVALARPVPGGGAGPRRPRPCSRPSWARRPPSAGDDRTPTRSGSGRGASDGARRPRARGRLRTPTRDEVVELLDREAHAPGDRVRVQPRRLRSGRRARPRRGRCGSPRPRSGCASGRIAEAHTASLADDELEVLGYATWLDALEAGIAAHHAGLVPAAQGGGRGGVHRGAGEGGLRHRDPRPRGEHARPHRGDREAHQVHRRAPRVPHRRASTPSSPGGPGGAASTSSGTRSCCWSPFVNFDQVASLAVAGHRSARLGVPAHVQHGRQPRRPLRPRHRPPPAQLVVRAVPGRPRRRGPGARALARDRAPRPTGVPAPADARRRRPRRSAAAGDRPPGRGTGS